MDRDARLDIPDAARVEARWPGGRGLFAACRGLGSAPVPTPAGNLPPLTRIELQHGEVDEVGEFIAWQRAMQHGRFSAQRTVALRLLDEAGTCVFAAELQGAIPTRVEGPGYRAGESQLTVERLEISFARLVLLAPADEVVR